MNAGATHVDPVRLAAGPEDYARFGLTKGHDRAVGGRSSPRSRGAQHRVVVLRLAAGRRRQAVGDPLHEGRVPASSAPRAAHRDRPGPAGREADVEVRQVQGRVSSPPPRTAATCTSATYLFTGDLHEYHITGSGRGPLGRGPARVHHRAVAARDGTSRLRPRRRDHLRLGALRAHGQGDGDLPHRRRGARDDRAWATTTTTG